jgi:para-nitrobenzyl esterase
VKTIIKKEEKMKDTVVETSSGKIRGMDLGPVVAWKGIPYASPPIGERRFQPPQPPDPWTGIRDATAFGPIAPQLPFLVANVTLEVEMPEPQSEDCLYLNIWAPHPDGRKRPVMVWVHGGALLNGSGSQSDYDGVRFAEQGDLILVTINYRLGVLGFLYSERFWRVHWAMKLRILRLSARRPGSFWRSLVWKPTRSRA